MVQYEQEGGSAGLKVLQVSAFDAESTVAALIWDTESMVVNLVVLATC